MDKSRKAEVLIGLIFPLLLLLFTAGVLIHWNRLNQVFTDPRSFASWVDAQPAAPLVFIAVQFLQVLIFMIPGEVPQIAGGYLFGTAKGLLLSFAGIGIGSGVNFFIGRFFGSRFVNILLGDDRFRRFSDLISSSRAHTGLFLFFLIPGFPKDALCYLAGVSSIRIPLFFILSLAGRFPGLVTSVMAGSAAAGGNWILLGIITSLVVLITVLAFLYRKNLKKFVDQIVHRH